MADFLRIQEKLAACKPIVACIAGIADPILCLKLAVTCQRWKAVIEHGIASFPATPTMLPKFIEVLEQHLAAEPNCLNICLWLVSTLFGREIPAFAHVDSDYMRRRQPQDVAGCIYAGHFGILRREEGLRLRISLCLYNYKYNE